MKRPLILLILLPSLLLFGCSSPSDSPPPNTPPPNTTLPVGTPPAGPTLQINNGGVLSAPDNQLALHATLLQANSSAPAENVTWSSNNPDIQVSPTGVVSAQHFGGSAVIQARSGTLQASIEVGSAELQPNARPLKEDEYVLLNNADGTLSLRLSETAKNTVKIGDVVFPGNNNTRNDHFLGRINALTLTDQGTVAALTEASITDAIVNGSVPMNLTVDTTAASALQTQTLHALSGCETNKGDGLGKPTLTEYEAKLNTPPILISQPPQGQQEITIIAGLITMPRYTITLDLNADVTPGTIKEEYDGTFSATCSADLRLPYSVNLRIEKFALLKLGPSATFSFNFTAGGKASLEAKLGTYTVKYRKTLLDLQADHGQIVNNPVDSTVEPSLKPKEDAGARLSLKTETMSLGAKIKAAVGIGASGKAFNKEFLDLTVLEAAIALDNSLSAAKTSFTVPAVDLKQNLDGSFSAASAESKLSLSITTDKRLVNLIRRTIKMPGEADDPLFSKDFEIYKTPDPEPADPYHCSTHTLDVQLGSDDALFSTPQFITRMRVFGKPEDSPVTDFTQIGDLPGNGTNTYTFAFTDPAIAKRWQFIAIAETALLNLPVSHGVKTIDVSCTATIKIDPVPPVDGKVGSTVSGDILVSNTKANSTLTFHATTTGSLTLQPTKETISNDDIISTRFETVHFTAPCLVTGSRTETVTVTSNDTTNPAVSVPVTINCIDGAGPPPPVPTPPAPVTPPHMTFQLPVFSMPAGKTQTLPLTFKNTGGQTWHGAIFYDSNYFYSYNRPVTTIPLSELIPGADGSFGLGVICDSVPGQYSATIHVTGDADNTPLDLPIAINCTGSAVAYTGDDWFLTIPYMALGGGGGYTDGTETVRTCNASAEATAIFGIDASLDKSETNFITPHVRHNTQTLLPLTYKVEHVGADGDKCNAERDAFVDAWVAARKAEAISMYKTRLVPEYAANNVVGVGIGDGNGGTVYSVSITPTR